MRPSSALNDKQAGLAGHTGPEQGERLAPASRISAQGPPHPSNCPSGLTLPLCHRGGHTVTPPLHFVWSLVPLRLAPPRPRPRPSSYGSLFSVPSCRSHGGSPTGPRAHGSRLRESCPVPCPPEPCPPSHRFWALRTPPPPFPSLTSKRRGSQEPPRSPVEPPGYI